MLSKSLCDLVFEVKKSLDIHICATLLTMFMHGSGFIVIEGLVSASKVSSFKLPYYDPNEEELKEMIRKEGSFQVNDLETHGFGL